MGEAIAAKTVDLEWVLVRPTALVKPDGPDAKIKFFAAETTRGVGSLVLDTRGPIVWPLSWGVHTSGAMPIPLEQSVNVHCLVIFSLSG